MEKSELSKNNTSNTEPYISHVKQRTKILWLVFVLGILQPGIVVANDLDSGITESLDGEVTVIHIDEVDPEKSRMAYFLQKHGSSEFVEMMFEGGPSKHSRKYLRTGKKVRIKGQRSERRAKRHARKHARQEERQNHQEILVSEVAELGGNSSTNTANGSAVPVTAGDRKTITFLINMDGVDYAAKGVSPYSQIHVDNSGKAMHDPGQFSVNSVYQEASFGQVTFSGSPATDVFLVSIPYDTTEACAFRRIASRADAASPVSLDGYQHRMYVVPPKAISGCGWLALGEVGNYGSAAVRSSWSTRIDPIAFAHELGHNLGWHHAATDPDNDGTRNVEYGDTSDLMGYCCSKRKLNSVHLDQVGWFDRADLREKIVDVTESGRFTIAPLGTAPLASSDPQILRISPVIGRPYYLSYRQKTGLDQGMSSAYTTGVNIHRGTESDNWSYLIQVLNSDVNDPTRNEFHDASNNLTISQVEDNANYVTIDIGFGGKCVVGNTQAVLTPSTQEVKSLMQPSFYTMTIINNDTVECRDTNYQVSLISVKDSQGKEVSLITGPANNVVVTVGPQSQGSTVIPLAVTGVSNGSYALALAVSDQDAIEPKHVDQVTGLLNVNRMVCEIGTPQVSVTPSSQVLTDIRQAKPLVVTVANTDNPACSPTNWTVGIQSPLSGVVQDRVMTVGPGQSGTTTIELAMEDAANGIYPLTIQVADQDRPSAQHTNAGDATIEVKLPVCDLGTPTLELMPSSQLVQDVTTVQPFIVNLTNRDSSACGVTHFAVALGHVVDEEGTVVPEISGMVQDMTLAVEPGGTTSTIVNLALTEVPDATYVIPIRVSDRDALVPIHTQTVLGTLQIQTKLQAPLAPTNLTADLRGRGGVTLQWSSPSGVAGIASYDVYRNGLRVVSTSQLQFNDSHYSRSRPNEYEVYSISQNGMKSSTAARTIYIDVAPDAPSGLTTILEGGKWEKVTLAWNSGNKIAQASELVNYYIVYRDGVRLGFTRELRLDDYNFSLTQPNAYEVYAMGWNGKLSEGSQSVSYVYGDSSLVSAENRARKKVGK